MVDIKQQLHGVIGFPVTPFTDDLSVDFAALERNVDEMAGYGFCAMVAAGGTGELYSLTPEEAIDVVRVTTQAVAGRMPVFGGVGYNATMAVGMARGMEKAGASALLVMPPYYVNAPEEGMTAYFQAIGNHCGLPLSFYSRDWAVFTPQQVIRLTEAVPTLKIWKDGQGDTRKYQRMISIVGDRLAWLGGIGDDCAPGYFSIGCQAYTSSISSVAPRMSLRISEYALSGNRDGLNKIMHDYVHPLYALRDRKRGYEVSIMKAMMEMMGRPAGPVRPPLTAPSAQDLADLKVIVESYLQFEADAAKATA